MEIADESVLAIYLRLKEYVERLETLIMEVEAELQENREEREDWHSWHSDWKNAWLISEPGDELTPEEIEINRHRTSVNTRNMILNFKKEILGLKEELESIRDDREKMQVYLFQLEGAIPA